MTVYRIDNVYYNEDTVQQYIEQHHSFADFILKGLQEATVGNLRGILNTIFRIWNSENQGEVSNYLNALNCLYVSYVNNILTNIPRFTVLDGGKKLSSDDCDVSQSKDNEND